MSASFSADSAPETARDAALWLLARGYAPLPLPHRSKSPNRDNWPAFRVTPAEVPRAFPEPSNVGVILGAASGGLVDIDLDCPEARAAAPVLLPGTGMVSGRASAPGSHWWYVVGDPPAKASDSFLDPASGARAKLLELRSSGGQTVVPPSTYPADPAKGHPEPEPCVWHRRDEPARVDLEELHTAVAGVAAAALLARHWPAGVRHDAALALAGGLLRAGWTADRIERLVRAVCAGAGDREVGDRVGAVRDTVAQVGAGEHATGWPTLERVLGTAGATVVGTVRIWLRCHRTHTDSAGRSSESSCGVHGRPVPEYTPIAPYAPFPTDCLPAPWGAFVREGAAALRCDHALVALPLLAVLAGAVGNARRVHLGAEWFEPAVLWTCVVAESGGRKSPAADLSAERVKARQKKLVKEFRDATKEYKRALAEYKTRRREDPDGDPGDEPHKPALGRVLVSDITIEKLAGLLDDNRRGLLVYRDELAGWLGSFTRYKGAAGGSDEPNWLSVHRGDALIYDRKTGDKTSVFVPHACVSVFGGIQPGTLKRLASRDLFDSGLVARLVFAMPPRAPKTWSDDQISPETKAAADRSLDALYALGGDVDEDGDPRPLVVALAGPARERLKGFVNAWGLKQFEAKGERAAALAKLEALPGRFALIHHTVATAADPGNAGPIGLASLEAGIRIAEWCARETERVYALIQESVGDKEVRKLVELVGRLAARDGGRTTVKALQNGNSRKYRTSDAAKADLERLVGLGLGHWETGPAPARGGKAVTYFVPGPSEDGPAHSCTTHDDSDDRPAGEGTEPVGTDREGADYRSAAPDGRDTPRVPDPGATRDPATGCGESPGAGTDRSSESSCVVHERDRETHVGTEAAPVPVDRRYHTNPESDPDPIVDRSGLARVVGAVGIVSRVALDLETTGLNPARDRVRLLSLAMPTDTFLVDLFALGDSAAALAPLFAVLAEKELVGHNIVSFDLPFLARLGFAPARVFDTALASRVVHAGERADHDLASAVKRELNLELDKTEQAGEWSRPVLSPAQLKYAATDASVLLPLADARYARAASRNLTGVLDLEMRCGVPVARMAATGVGFDTGTWLALADVAAERRVSLATEMDALVPNPNCLPGLGAWNWNSTTVDVPAAFEAVGITLPDTKEETLAGIAHPLARLLLEYREAAKRAGTYGRTWVAEHVTDGRVCASWNPCQAKTGRMSCSRPNLQQVPRDPAYRRCFTARPGNILVKCDFSQIELRIAAKVTGDARMLAAYRSGEDLHTLTAARFLGTPVGEVTKEARQMAKPVNFGAIYGLGPRSLRLKARADYGKDMTEDQARGFLDAFFAQFPAVRAWHHRLKRDHSTEVRTLGGRRIGVEPDQFFGAKANYVVQGTGGDGLKRALVLLWERRDQCPNTEVALAVHDEIVLEVPEAERDGAAAWLSRCMVDGMAPLVDPVPVEVEVKIGTTWAG